MDKRFIVLGCDHAGYELKEFLKNWLQDMGYEIRDYGTFSNESVDYPDFIHPAAKSVSENEADMAIVICGSGNGAAMTANKYGNVRAALCWNKEISALARQHNDANVLALPARFLNFNEAKEIVRTFLNTDFENERHSRRIEKIPVR
ncbi:MAG TPA: ribose 5-phosphate isomerase B [Bacteroidia bacterium]|nr:ribose 5-phosphate isomerase B [Sphingobacteriales bacterium]HPD66358.1 ribose 5-phosphate isomerase B [Bacteroidia bacterium]HRS59956.1 ribose 5-phosphate isomerase B [Bacteroidia bacterium]HRU69161.1 ribose 5-phosphate isomerase B [Bacteroidia bacterium]